MCTASVVNILLSEVVLLPHLLSAVVVEALHQSFPPPSVDGAAHVSKYVAANSYDSAVQFLKYKYSLLDYFYVILDS